MSRPTLRAGGAALLAAALLAGLAGCASQSQDAAGSTAPTADPTAAPSDGSGGDTTQVVPGQPQPTLPPVAKGQPADYGNGVTVTLVGTQAITITGEGPGETSGPGVLYTLRLQNRSGAGVDLAGATVTATDGEGTAMGPALAVGSPFTGSIPSGGSAEGSYAFVVAQDQRSSVTLAVTLSPDVPVAALTV